MNSGEKILVTESMVTPDSLPRSLRHHGKGNAMADAKELLHMLYGISTYLTDEQIDAPIEQFKGLRLVIDLVIDKLDIADGSYEFPTFSYAGDLPALARRTDHE